MEQMMRREFDGTELSYRGLAQIVLMQEAFVAGRHCRPSPADWCRAWFVAFVIVHGEPPSWPSHSDDEALGLSTGILDQGAWALVGAGGAIELDNGSFVVLRAITTVH